MSTTSEISTYFIEQLIIHKVGNKLEHEGVFISESTIHLQEDTNALLSTYFSTPFKSEEQYQFYGDVELEDNKVYNWVKEIFNNPDNLIPFSAQMAHHLYENSGHARIKGGEFYVAYFKNCMINGTQCDAIGLFKSENKDTFLKVYPDGEQLLVGTDTGINIQKLDKGCLIYNVEAPTGYLCKVLDKSNKGNETVYWFDYFLHVRQVSNDYFFTEQMITICKEFVKNELPEEFEVTKADQADIFIKTEQYLNNKEDFDFEEFTQTILEQPEVQNKFADFRYEYQQEHQLQLEDNFNISNAAVKKKKSFLRSKIKLDKNFTIYVHGNSELIVNEVDEMGRKYYKIYYDNEQ
jgi:hypothetical protein